MTFLPPVPEPPHDPRSLLLDARAGWREGHLQGAEIAPDDGVLTLVPMAGAVADDGTLGGHVLPASVALSELGELYLLDATDGVLLRFDPCLCRFERVPCTGGIGHGPRQLQRASGLAICRGNLFLCDAGNHRVSVFARHGWVLRGHWAPPQGEVAQAWEPVAAACDRRGRLYVADPANGMIHRFARTGQWQTAWHGLGDVIQVAIDRRDHLYAVVRQANALLHFSETGMRLPDVARVETVAGYFPRLPFAVLSDGALDLRPLCVEVRAGAGDAPCGQPLTETLDADVVFDARGRPIKRTETSPPQYVAQGVYISQALDAKIFDCVWHRVILNLALPTGTSVEVWTHTAEVELPFSYILNLPPDAWQTAQRAVRTQGGEWDCLIRSQPGRYLWLMLRLVGSGIDTPEVSSVQLEFPRISLSRYLPAVFVEEPLSADFSDRFLSIFDTTLRSLERHLDTLPRFFDPRSAPVAREGRAGLDFLTWLASWIDVAPDRHMPEAQRREYVKEAIRVRRLHGTRLGLYRHLLVYLGVDPDRCLPELEQPLDRCEPLPANCVPRPKAEPNWRPPLILEHYQLRRWLLVGEGRLGDQARLWGERIVNRSQLDHSAQADRSRLNTTQDPYRDPFHVSAHRFSVFVPSRYGRTAGLRRGLHNLLETEKPGHAMAQIEYVAPRFRVGVQSMIGFDAVVGRYPQGMTLAIDAQTGQPLGKDTVLTAPPGQTQPAMQIGKTGRVSSTSQLS